MCHQKEAGQEPIRRYKKVFLTDHYGEIIAGPVKVVGPVRVVDTPFGLSWEARVYGKAEYLPSDKSSSWVKFKNLYTKYGIAIM